MSSGRIFVISGPSGVGKGTLCKKLLLDHDNLVLSISATSRPQRPGEADERDYFFKTREEFEAMIQNGELLEWAEYNGNYYGTPRRAVEAVLSSGSHVLLEIEVQGALQVKKQFPEAVLVFIAPPSLGELEARLRGRGTDGDEVIRERLRISEWELAQQACFDCQIVNDELTTCYESLKALIQSS